MSASTRPFKLYLAKQGLVGSLTELQSQIDRFVAYYNECRPHRSLGRRTPREVFDEMVKGLFGFQRGPLSRRVTRTRTKVLQA